MEREQATKRWEKWRNQRNYFKNHNGAEETEQNSTKTAMMQELIGQIDRELINTNPNKGKEIKLEK